MFHVQRPRAAADFVAQCFERFRAATDLVHLSLILKLLGHFKTVAVTLQLNSWLRKLSVTLAPSAPDPLPCCQSRDPSLLRVTSMFSASLLKAQ